MTLLDLEGLWRREFIQVAGLDADHATQVLWLQAGRFFCDLRQPADLALFDGVRCLRDLTVGQLRDLARQEGFGGVLTLNHDVAEWHRQIDFQPDSGLPDRARLALAGDVLTERGTERPYVERWLRERAAVTPAWGARLIDPTRGRGAVIVRAGQFLMFARDRPGSVAPGATLAARFDAAKTVTEKQDLLDFEISFGRIEQAHQWRIERSSLPFKTGRLWRFYLPSVPSDLLRIEDLTNEGEVVTRTWQRSTHE